MIDYNKIIILLNPNGVTHSLIIEVIQSASHHILCSFVTITPNSGDLIFSPPMPGEPANQLKTTITIESI